MDESGVARAAREMREDHWRRRRRLLRVRRGRTRTLIGWVCVWKIYRGQWGSEVAGSNPGRCRPLSGGVCDASARRWGDQIGSIFSGDGSCSLRESARTWCEKSGGLLDVMIAASGSRVVVKSWLLGGWGWKTWPEVAAGAVERFCCCPVGVRYWRWGLG